MRFAGSELSLSTCAKFRNAQVAGRLVSVRGSRNACNPSGADFRRQGLGIVRGIV